MTQTCLQPLGSSSLEAAANSTDVSCTVEIESNGVGQGEGTAMLENGTLKPVVRPSLLSFGFPSRLT